MIDRGFLGKVYPVFSVVLSDAFVRRSKELLSQHGCPVSLVDTPPLNWPSFMTLHGTACLLNVWEDLGVDPLAVRLVREEFVHMRPVKGGADLMGRVTIEDLTEHMTSDGTIEEQVCLEVVFQDLSGTPVANYRCAFRIPVAIPDDGMRS